ncbi:MAG: Ig-like domain-containing protein [Bacteroidota bacterium]
MLRIAALLSSIFSILFLTHCANPGSLSGGPRDEQPPKLDSLESTPNLQTNFELQEIVLTFDEWIKLDNPFTQIVISPPLDPKPEVTLKGKSVFVEFEEGTILRENATYTINFGEAIQDLTEGNPAEDLRFVFSTGDFIDSLEVSGTITDLEEGEGVEDALVMLYDNLADTVVRTELPFYFAKTDKEGKYKIQNVRADTFKVFALKEPIGINYKYDFEEEEIAFPDSFLVVTDTSTNVVDLRIFKEAPDLAIQNIDQSQYGRTLVEFNQEPYNLTFRYEANFEALFLEYEKDSLRIWYDLPNPADSSAQFIISQDTLLKDTFLITNKKRADFLANSQLKLSNDKQNIIKQNPLKALKLVFNHPLADFDSSRFQLLADSLKTPVKFVVEIDSTEAKRTLLLQHKWNENLPYELLVLPNAVGDIYGLENQDSIQKVIDIQAVEDFGNIDLTVTGLDSTLQYVVTLGLDNAPPLGRFVVSDQSTWQQTFQAIPKGKYEVEIVTDYNRNGKWDTGDYDLKRQPEPISSQTLEELRAGWDLESEVKLAED